MGKEIKVPGVGCEEGELEGCTEGGNEGQTLGSNEGSKVGLGEGRLDGEEEGAFDGDDIVGGFVGLQEGVVEGLHVNGRSVG